MVLGTMEAQKWTLRFLLSIKEETTLGRTHTGITLDTTFACLLEQCTFSYPVSVSNVNASSLEGVCVCIRINHQWWNSEQKKKHDSHAFEKVIQLADHQQAPQCTHIGLQMLLLLIFLFHATNFVLSMLRVPQIRA